MLNSIAVRGLLCSMLCCIPGVAIFDGGDLLIRVGGAVSGGPDRFFVAEKATVSVSAKGDPGDLIWVYAIGPGGDTLTLMLGQPADGRVYGEFRVPTGTAGNTYKIHAMAQNMDGELKSAKAVLIEVRKPASLIDPIGK